MKQRLEELMQKDIADLMGYVSNKLQQYYSSYSQQQKKAIMQNMDYLKAFLRADLYADYGFADKDPEAKVPQNVFNYKKKALEPH